MISSLEWQLRLISWDLFVTLTWDDVENTTPRERINQVNRWIKYCSERIFAKRADQLSVATRYERGEVGDRPHCHLLISRVPVRRINLTTCFRMRHYWEHTQPHTGACTCTDTNTSDPKFAICGRGIAQVRLYEPTAGGERYMTKGKFSAEWAQGANAYELKKFDGDLVDALMINEMAMREMFTARNSGKRMTPVEL